MVKAVTAERPGALELAVEVDGSAGPVPAVAVAYPALTGAVGPGDRVLLNTTAVALHLGTGGVHFVVAVEGRGALEVNGPGHVMKLRYTPAQVAVRAVEEPGGAWHDALAAAESLDGVPVVWTPLHSMVGPAAAGARAAGAERVVYVMTGGAALAAGFSRQTAALRDAGLLSAVVSSGQAFGGDLETVNLFTGLLAARHVAGADVVVVGDGPGNTGTGTPWGATDIESAMAMNAAAILEGRPVAALRISFADSRPRHRGVSHHSLTALSRVALSPVHVAVPALEDDEERRIVWETLAGLPDHHHLVETTGRPALDLLAEHGIEPESMGRRVADDPAFFLAAGAAGVLAARVAGGSPESRDEGGGTEEG